MSTIIGIDPGKSGGIAVIKSYGNERLPDVWADKMPETPADILGYFDSLLVDATAFIEQVNAAGDPNFRGVLARAKLYGNYCSVEMALLAAKISCEPVTAAKWQKAMGCSRPGMPYADKKRFNKERAQQLFPRLKVTLDIADALLIAEYGRRLRS